MNQTKIIFKACHSQTKPKLTNEVICLFLRLLHAYGINRAKRYNNLLYMKKLVFSFRVRYPRRIYAQEIKIEY